MNFRAWGTLVLAAGTFIFATLWLQQRKLASELAAHSAQRSSDAARIRSLETELQRTKTLLTATDQKAQAELKEVTRLRGLVRALEETERSHSRLKAQRDQLEREIQSTRRTPDEETPEWKPAQARTRFAKVIGLAIRQYASRNDGEVPADLDAAISGLDEGRWEEWVIEHVSANAAVLNISEEQYELTFKGRLDTLPAKDLGMTLVAREKNPVRMSNGRWARACVFDDAHAELLVADTLDELHEKEAQYLSNSRP